jgi:hypothetical protein
MGITPGQGPPSPQNGSRLSLGTRRVNTKLNASERFPQTANAFHKSTEQHEIGKKDQSNVNELARSRYPVGESKRQRS